MKLSYKQICEITSGAAYITEENEAIIFRRFTVEEQNMYQHRRLESWLRSFATAGIRLEFETDSTLLNLSLQVLPSTSRRFFAHSIFVDGEKIGEISGELSADEQQLCLEQSFPLKEGCKRVAIYFPWSVESRLIALELRDGAYVRPVTKARKLLSYGDSITQGYDALKPENAYIVRLADALDAELTCKAIGGERFCPKLVEFCNVTDPDLITVAYGSNDWSLSDREEFLFDSREFFRILEEKFPNIPIVVLAPIWRADYQRETSVGDISKVALHFQSIAENKENMTVIDCFGFVPHDPDYFLDLKLHPNDSGFAYYADALIGMVKEII